MKLHATSLDPHLFYSIDAYEYVSRNDGLNYKILVTTLLDEDRIPYTRQYRVGAEPDGRFLPVLYRCPYPILDIIRMWNDYAGLTLGEFIGKLYNRST